MAIERRSPLLGFVPAQRAPASADVLDIEVAVLHRAAERAQAQAKSGVRDWMLLMAIRKWLLTFADDLLTESLSPAPEPRIPT